MAERVMIPIGENNEFKDHGIAVHPKTAAKALLIELDGVIHPFNPISGAIFEKVIDELNPKLHEKGIV